MKTFFNWIKTRSFAENINQYLKQHKNQDFVQKAKQIADLAIKKYHYPNELFNFISYDALNFLIRHIEEDGEELEDLNSYVNIWDRDYEPIVYILERLKKGPYPQINNLTYIKTQFSKDEDEFWNNPQTHQNLKQNLDQKKSGITTIIQLNGGWKWVSLNKGACDTEAEKMGHCGNVPSQQPGDNILSLRDPKGNPHLTFIVNNKILGESKGKNNEKPVPKYHKAIVQLLLSPYIEKIRGGGYEPEHNFKLSDLSEEDQKIVLAKKPDIVMHEEQQPGQPQQPQQIMIFSCKNFNEFNKMFINYFRKDLGFDMLNYVEDEELMPHLEHTRDAGCYIVMHPDKIELWCENLERETKENKIQELRQNRFTNFKNMIAKFK
jgi:hypothetical protein